MIGQNHEYYVSREVAKLLKEAGFDWKICGGYIIYEDGGGFTTEFQTPHNFNGDNGNLFIDYRGHKEVLSRPTIDVAQRWLREKMDLIITIEYSYHKNTFICKVYSKAECLSILFDFSVYEEAQEAGIKKALEIILDEEE